MSCQVHPPGTVSVSLSSTSPALSTVVGTRLVLSGDSLSNGIAGILQ